MDFQEQYKAKLRSVEGVLEAIKDGDVLHSGFCANTPRGIFRQLHTIASRVEHLTVYTDSDTPDYPYMQMPELRDRWHVASDFMATNTRRLRGRFPEMLDYYPGDITRVTKKYVEHSLGADVVLLAVTPMDKHGFFRHSLSCIKEPRLLRSAKTVIVQVNRNMPVVYGDTALHISDVDYICECDSELSVLKETESTEVETLIGRYAAELVQDKDTIQVGLGGIPNAICRCLMDKHDLGVQTEMLVTGMMDLYNAGVITNKYKKVMPGRMLASFILGSSRLYEFADQNPAVYLGDSENVVASHIMAQNDSMVSINTAIEVDLTGQVCSEAIGPTQFSGTGGATETAQGATFSPYGRSIVCLKSTALDGTKSTIRGGFDPGSIVTISRNTVDYIVTEYGIAVMRGRSTRARAQNLIAVAHPDFREELRQDAKKMGLI